VGEVLYGSIVITGNTLSIHVTVAVAFQVFPARSWNSKIKLPFQVKVCHDNHPLLVIIIASDQLNVAITFPLVAVAGL
jgi:hypothetical protein